MPGNKKANISQHRTGCVVGTIRKLHNWNLSTVLAEYRTFADPKPRDPDIQYLTAVEPAEFLREAVAHDAGHVVIAGHPIGPFSRLIAFVVVLLLLWFFTMYQIVSLMPTPSRRHA
ncbi:hypothetical protein IMZ48_22360 [Candidatus Bathyarchaeota archaeon]|nr:hypothetical protein [Candidatus Bathyarchaeota archaeon]